MNVLFHDDELDQLCRQHREDEQLAKALEEEAHTLLPADIASEIPPLYSEDGKGGEAIVHLKLFTPWTTWTWYVTEYDPAERVFFGLVHGQEIEFGYFSLAELEQIASPGGLRIERDLYWTTRPLKEIPDYQSWCALHPAPRSRGGR